MKRILLCLLFCLLPIISFAAVDMDGVDDRVEMADIAAIDAATELSVSAWVFHDSITGDDTIISKILTDSTDGFQFYRDDVASVSGRTDCYNITIFESGSTDNVRVETATNSTPSGAWTHIVFTWVGASATGLRVYINGSEDANSPANSANVNAVDVGTAICKLGTASSNNDRPFDGAITELAIWNKALSAAEVTSLYGAGSPEKGVPLTIETANLISYLPMNDGTIGTSADGDTLDDTSANSNTGTGVDGANNTGLAWAADPTWGTAGGSTPFFSIISGD